MISKCELTLVLFANTRYVSNGCKLHVILEHKSCVAPNTPQR